MSLRRPEEPTTAPPRARFGVLLDRYSRYESVECPECGEVGIDVWINEGATAARGVCVANECELDEMRLAAALEDGESA